MLINKVIRLVCYGYLARAHLQHFDKLSDRISAQLNAGAFALWNNALH